MTEKLSAQATYDIETKRLMLRTTWHSLKAHAWKDTIVSFFAGARGLREDVTIEDAIKAADRVVHEYERRFALGFDELGEDESQAVRAYFEGLQKEREAFAQSMPTIFPPETCFQSHDGQLGPHIHKS